MKYNKKEEPKSYDIFREIREDKDEEIELPNDIISIIERDRIKNPQGKDITLKELDELIEID